MSWVWEEIIIIELISKTVSSETPRFSLETLSIIGDQLIFVGGTKQYLTALSILSTALQIFTGDPQVSSAFSVYCRRPPNFEIIPLSFISDISKHGGLR